MKAVSSLVSVRRVSSHLVPLWEGLRGLAPRHFSAALVVGLLFALLHCVRFSWEYAQGASPLPLLPGYLLAGIAFVVGFVIADAYVRHGARPRLAYGIAVLTAAVGTSVIKWHVTAALGGHNWFGPEIPLVVQRTEMLAMAILLMAQGGFGIAVFLQWRESEASSLRLRANEMQRAKTERQMREAQLRAMQARIEPELLFSALQRVGELAEREANERADLLLDELIALLRLLMPGGNATDDHASTVQHELATAAAYLRIHDACAGASREIDVAIDTDAAALPLPPMLALAIARKVARRERMGRATLRIRAGRVEGTLRLEFARDGVGEPLLDASDLIDLRRRLDETFGSGAASGIVAEPTATLALHLPVRP